MYTLTENLSIIRQEDGAIIPTDLRNIDYKNYLQWVADGGQPDRVQEKKQVPFCISRAQGLLVLEIHGLLQLIEEYMKTAPRIEQLAWENIQQFERASPMLNALCSKFGLTADDVDVLFIEGFSIII